MATTTGPVFTLPIRLTVGDSTCETGVLEISGSEPVGPQLAAGMRELADVLRDVADGLDADEDQEVTTP
ncbi:hypothetical protein SEA_CUMBERBATCH_3 [Streptomyces phage Cumberbatch]|uniref:Uncharacterized protein n=1 Tax=Streptomyces phage Cumberbatch TaxID=2736271 RepID=A0A6M9Z5K2_9CAUD|nr:hypothetical protein QEN65_gp03 [Streptomyces phage Cumberbatch]YP_010756472.1 hypothetical protein QEN66_gp03 [Streptomyces phage Piccadilly]QKN87645.1 hypothetical protein SEA_CUMBERBATCH_3 [Streptomyces phage Cumberbatch]UJQ86015.1 hypothetical protein SEA_PICCADILLY_3 [Streptomyces phage Piccadilly]